MIPRFHSAFLVLLFLSALELLASQPAAHQYFVSTAGSDNNPGSVALPFKTIARAAQVAAAGDVVTVKAGTYAGHVTVCNEGTVDKPIVFEAEARGAAALSGPQAGFSPRQWAGNDDNHCESANHFVVLRGFTFRDIPSSSKAIVSAASGWTIEDCVFSHVPFGVNIRGHGVSVVRCRFEDVDAHALVGVGGRNIVIQSDTIRRVNFGRTQNIPHSAVVKFLFTDSLLVENVLSEDNFGPGFWLDWDNKRFVIRNNIFRNNKGDKHEWEGPGLWLEGNPHAEAKIYANTITGNAGAGIGIFESNGIEIYGNTVAQNGQCIEFRNMSRGEERFLQDISVHDNAFGPWREAAIETSIGEWQNFDPAKRALFIDRDTYRPSALRKPIFKWTGKTFGTLDEVKEKLGFEKNGSVKGEE